MLIDSDKQLACVGAAESSGADQFDLEGAV